jgi:hypothetical protein
MTEGRDPAKRRLWQLTLVRLAGIALVLLGMWLVGRAAGEALGMTAGLLVMAAGALLSLLGPKALARRWKP